MPLWHEVCLPDVWCLSATAKATRYVPSRAKAATAAIDASISALHDDAQEGSRVLKRFVWAGCCIPVLLFGWGDELAKQNRAAIVALQHKVQVQQERIDGLVSVIEGLNETIGQLRRENDKKGRDELLMRRIEELEARIAALESRKPTSAAVPAPTPKPVTAKKAAPKLPASKRYAKAVQAYKKRAYTTAKEFFSELVEEGYKPAASLFYLGEIAYYTKHYKDAVYYYKQSAERYDKAGYMDVLMLHTAISLEKTGQTAQAKAFYRSLVDTYKGRKSARIAAKRLRKLQ